jgi:hypothetical protein
LTAHCGPEFHINGGGSFFGEPALISYGGWTGLVLTTQVQQWLVHFVPWRKF